MDNTEIKELEEMAEELYGTKDTKDKTDVSLNYFFSPEFDKDVKRKVSIKRKLQEKYKICQPIFRQYYKLSNAYYKSHINEYEADVAKYNFSLFNTEQYNEYKKNAQIIDIIAALNKDNKIYFYPLTCSFFNSFAMLLPEFNGKKIPLTLDKVFMDCVREYQLYDGKQPPKQLYGFVCTLSAIEFYIEEHAQLTDDFETNCDIVLDAIYAYYLNRCEREKEFEKTQAVFNSIANLGKTAAETMAKVAKEREEDNSNV